MSRMPSDARKASWPGCSGCPSGIAGYPRHPGHPGQDALGCPKGIRRERTVTQTRIRAQDRKPRSETRIGNQHRKLKPAADRPACMPYVLPNNLHSYSPDLVFRIGSQDRKLGSETRIGNQDQTLA